MSIANDKGTDITQLEFQSMGQASTSTTLIQPLLEHASTYNCHIMNLVTSMGDHFAVPGQELLRVVPNPFCTRDDLALQFAAPFAALNPTNLAGGVGVPAGPLPVVMRPCGWAGFGPANMVNFLEDIESGAYMNHEFTTFYSYDPTLLGHVVNELCYKLVTVGSESSIDFVWQMQRELKESTGALYQQLGATAAINAARVWDDNDLIQVCVNLKGNLKLKVKTELFKRGFMIILSPFFRKMLGTDKQFMTMYFDDNDNTAKLVTTVREWEEMFNWSPTTFSLELLNVTIPTNGERQVLSFGDSIYERADFRKKLIMDVTFPIDATLVVKDEKPEIIHQMQEFELRPGTFTAKYGGFNKIINNNIVRCNVAQQEQLLGPRILLDNISSLAVKKLYEGQMQTIRIDLVLEYQDWDGEKFVDKREPLQFSQPMFNYLKFIFCKEVV